MAAKKRAKKSVIRFHREIYKEAAVKAAARDYAGFACFSISWEGVYIKTVITPKDAALPACLTEEFANRVLFNSI
ncbi:MAG: hypothetical protein A2021_07055 [Elusimicrobia bacterium GWF2_52_66]|nr:MAG: hypothetical protein A2X33_03740 [Elusimicrobia bacterium GWA2_51_34]OGR88080.1 MAG: hypothetical protein A2021_07055 [Elusimicrobia bacterium GWF2_52_66]HAF95751.1 hypothetical protein [Elusimicrobiota bacterium]HCE97736.1 hypothetical protein [Elusimicrobiota bacterium]